MDWRYPYSTAVSRIWRAAPTHSEQIASRRPAGAGPRPIAESRDDPSLEAGWHFCFANAWGNDLISSAFPEGYQIVLPHFFDTPGIDEFVLDYANRDMKGIEFMKHLPKEKSLQAGVLDIRTNMIESPKQIADRIRKVIAAVSPDRVTLSTDCGMKPLPRMVARTKLRALVQSSPEHRSTR